MSRAIPSKSAQPAPNRRKIIVNVTMAIIVVAIIVGVGLASRVPKAASVAPTQAKLAVGDTAPEFSVQTNAGPFDLASINSPVLLEVFATWCPHCQRETVVLNDLVAKYGSKAAIVAVSGSAQGMDATSPESQADVNAFGERFSIRYPIAYDPDLTVATKYLQGGYPTLVMIDSKKKITWIDSGEVPEATLAKAITSAQ
jgi:thiol-disulfide isomerase/thioredoxin